MNQVIALGKEVSQSESLTNHPQHKLDVQEAATWLGLSVSTLNKLRLTGEGPRYYKLGRRVVYDLCDLEAWAAERVRRSTSEPFRLRNA